MRGEVEAGGEGGVRGAGGRGLGVRGGDRREVKARAYVFTISNYFASVNPLAPMPALQGNMKYLIYGREVCPATGTPHLQGYVYYVNPVRNPHTFFSAFGPHAHVERAVGTAEENQEYCSKDGDFTEYGVLPASQKAKGERGGDVEKKRWEDAFLAAKKGRMDDIPDDLRTRYYSTYQKIKWDHAPPAGHLDGELQHLWIVGESGSGKSTWAFR